MCLALSGTVSGKVNAFVFQEEDNNREEGRPDKISPLFCLFTNVILMLVYSTCSEKNPTMYSRVPFISQMAIKSRALSRTGRQLLDLSCMRHPVLCEPSMSLSAAFERLSKWHLHCQSVSGSELGESSFSVSSDRVTVTGHSTHPTFLWLPFLFAAVSWRNSESFLLNHKLSTGL